MGSLFPEYDRPEIKLLSDYTTVIVSSSAGIDSTGGALYWALKNYPKESILVLHCDTDLEPIESWPHLVKMCQHLGLRYPVKITHPQGYFGILEQRMRFPDSRRRWCTAYLKSDLTEKWIRQNRLWLGKKVLFATGERWDESSRRSKLKHLTYHPTHLKTRRAGEFLCHWYRPALEYEKGKMFERSKELGIPPHDCYTQGLSRCSCIACFFSSNAEVMKNMRRHPEQFRRLIAAELKSGHTWKRDQSLKELWDWYCEDGVPENVTV